MDRSKASARRPTRLVSTLAARLRADLGLSHGQAKSLISAGRVRIDGQPVFDAGARPPAESVVEVASHGAPKSQRPLFGPGFRVVHLDDAVVVVEKDAGVVTVPTAKEKAGDLPLVARVVAAMGHAGHRIKQGLWVVHRIDRSTSGLVLFARSEAAARTLRAQFRARRPLREYLAWTEGQPHPEHGRLHHRLSEDESSRRVRVVRTGPGQDAELEYTVEAATASPLPRARVRVRLVTGRRNQIRAQFAASGWPILGDFFYGASDPGPGRTALHAARLGFAHPRTGAELVFESTPPADLAALDRRLFANPRFRRE